MSKRGISPLIATVLIVGMTIAIAATVFIFLKGQTELIAKKGDAKFSAQEEATVDFEVLDCKSPESTLDITIRNTGKNKIDCFWVAPKDGATKLSVFNMKEGKEDTLKLNVPGIILGVNLYPCLIEKNKVKTGSKAVSATCV